MTVDRERLRDTANYLRNVRPIDPEEVYEYLPNQPHPAVVREALREEAFELELIERSDGTFVPVDTEPVPLPDWAPTMFPERYSRALEDLLVDEFGPDWHRGDSGDCLRQTIRDMKEEYYRNRSVEYDRTTALGYAVYHLPDYYAAIGYVLDTLVERGLVDRHLRVVDVGAGTGGPVLGIHDYLPDDAVVDYHAIEPSASADVLERLAEETRRNFRVTIHRTRAETFDPLSVCSDRTCEAADTGDVDILLFANVLSELGDPVAVVDRYLTALAPSGSCLLVAPADLETSVGLRSVDRELTSSDGPATPYAPELRLWPDSTPADRGWSFDERPELDSPAFQRRLDDPSGEPGTFLNTSVRFSYAVVRTDGKRRIEVQADPDRHARLAESDRHVTERIDALAVKLSHDLSGRNGNTNATDTGSNPVFRVGDGSQQVDHYAVLARESSLNRSLREARYGAVVSFENVLVLWNDDEGAYNLVVDDETVVDRIAK